MNKYKMAKKRKKPRSISTESAYHYFPDCAAVSLIKCQPGLLSSRCLLHDTYQIHLVKLHFGVAAALVESELHPSGPGNHDLVPARLEHVRNLSVQHQLVRTAEVDLLGSVFPPSDVCPKAVAEGAYFCFYFIFALAISGLLASLIQLLGWTVWSIMAGELNVEKRNRNERE